MCACVLSHSIVSNSLWPHVVAHQAHLFMAFSMQEYWSGLPFPSPGILLIQGSNLGLLHCRWILYCLSHRGSPYWHLLHVNHRVGWESETRGHKLEFSISFPSLFYHKFYSRTYIICSQLVCVEWGNGSFQSSINWTPNRRDRSKSVPKTCCDDVL